jgi:hypothetical protein
LNLSSEPYATRCRNSAIKLHDNRMVDRVARTAVNQEAVLYGNRSWQYQLCFHKSPFVA